MIIERSFPATVELGETLTAIFRILSVVGYTDGTTDPGDPVDTYRVEFTDSSSTHAEVEYPAVVSADNFRFDIAAMDPDPAMPFWEAGSFSYRIIGQWTRGGTRRELSIIRGIVDVKESGAVGSNRLSHARAMIVFLRGILHDKACGTADIASYSIGTRDISLLSYAELHREITRYESDIIRLSGGYPAYDSGTEVV